MPIQRQPAHKSAVVDYEFPAEAMRSLLFFMKEAEYNPTIDVLRGLARYAKEMAEWAEGIRRAGA